MVVMAVIFSAVSLVGIMQTRPAPMMFRPRRLWKILSHSHALRPRCMGSMLDTAGASAGSSTSTSKVM